MSASVDRRPLKILHIDPERNWGGGEAQVIGLLSYLAERGHRNDLLTHPDGRLFQQSQALSVRTIPLVVRNDLDLRRRPRLRRLIRRRELRYYAFSHQESACIFVLAIAQAPQDRNTW